MTSGITAELLDGGLAEDLATASLVGDLMRRAPAWGAASAWIGSGPCPAARAADHVLWIADQDPMAPATGGFVFLYHLLWDLTHICFEHPGLLEPEPEGADDACVTCGDEGRLAEVVGPASDDLDPSGFGTPGLGTPRLGSMALVRTAAGQETIDVTLVAACGAAMAERFAAGGRLYAFGNGGSSTDCATFAALFAAPPVSTPPVSTPPASTSGCTQRSIIRAQPRRRHRMSPAVTSGGAQASREDQPSREQQVIDRITARRKRRPRLIDEVVTLAHGAGGKSSAALVDAVFVEAFRNPELEQLGDGAVLRLPSGERLAFSTDSFVVSPLRFPGGSIGHLAVHGTVNDLAVSGAVPRWLSAAFVIEEGFAVSDLREIVADMAAAASRACVALVTGDTKVVPKGAADGLYVTTTGVGIVPADRELSMARVRPGDKVLLSGTLADHGMAVMLARGDLGIEADIRSDTAPIGGAVEALLAAAPATRWMRDPTRGGLGSVCNELAGAAGVAVILDEEALPVTPLVQGACDLLGIDPVYVACEGKFAAVVPANEADDALGALRAHPLGRDACVIGEIRAEPAGLVALRNAFGGTRIVDMLVGDPLPRIC